MLGCARPRTQRTSAAESGKLSPSIWTWTFIGRPARSVRGGRIYPTRTSRRIRANNRTESMSLRETAIGLRSRVRGEARSGGRCSSERPSGCARTGVGPSMHEPWDSGSTTSSKYFPAAKALGYTFGASLLRRVVWGSSSRGSWGDAFCACWKKDGEPRQRFASGMHHERMGTPRIST